MSQTTKHLGFLIKNRGEYISNPETKYYKDNVVQYMNSSFICDPQDYDETTNPLAYVIEPPLNENSELNKGWKIFAVGSDTLAQQAIEDAKRTALNEINNAIESYAPVQITGDVTNAADEEDLTSVSVEGTDVLKFKDKTYNPLVYSGLGRKILRKNIVNGVNTLTQSMMQATNTIYVIQYDFDLNGASVTVPANCVLQFEGGSLSNGTINGSKYQIEATDVKIFDNIKFTGKSADVTLFNVSWFVDKTVDDFIPTITGEEYDSSEQFNYMFSCGARNFIMPCNKFFYVSHPIIINPDTNNPGVNINIYRDRTNELAGAQSRSEAGWAEGCIYSNEIITLLIYHYNCRAMSYGLTLAGVTFRCNKKFDDLDDKTEPIVSIDTVNGDTSSYGIWGLNFDCNIFGTERNIIYDGISSYIPSYTGLAINATAGYITMTRIHGEISYTYYGILLSYAPQMWITDTELHAMTRCVIGGIFNGGAPVKIYNSHQPIAALSNDEYLNTGYFKSSWIIMNGYVWDTGAGDAQTLRSCGRPFVLNTENGRLVNNTYLSPNESRDPLFSALPDGGKIRTYFSTIDWELHSTNLLKQAVITKALGSSWGLIKNLQYKVDDNDLFSLNSVDGYSVYNLHNVFDESLFLFKVPNTEIGTVPFVNCPTATSHSVHIEFKFDVVSSRLYMQYPNTNVGTISITVTKNGVSKVMGFKDYYYKGLYFTKPIEAGSVIEIDYTFSSDTFILPNLFVPSDSSTQYKHIYSETGTPKISKLEISNVGSLVYNIKYKLWMTCSDYNGIGLLWSGLDGNAVCVRKSLNYIKSSLALTNNVVDQGTPFYATDKKIYYYFDGTTWRTLDGIKDGTKRAGTTAQRPAYDSGISEGFAYFDTTIGRMIFAKAFDSTNQTITWIEQDGATAGVLRSGTFANKPAADKIYVGFRYFCTDKQTTEGATNGIEIIHKGNNVWVDALGRVIS